jgi:hypothetical protein
MKISAEPGRITISNDGSERALATDGKKVRQERSNGVGADVTAHWKGSKLVVTTELDTGRKLTETYELVADGLRIIDTVTAEGGEPPLSVTVKHVYDRSDKKEGLPPAPEPTPPPAN